MLVHVLGRQWKRSEIKSTVTKKCHNFVDCLPEYQTQLTEGNDMAADPISVNDGYPGFRQSDAETEQNAAWAPGFL